MKSLAVVSAAALALAGCNPLNLTPQQQLNLQNELALGAQFIKGAGTVYCEYSPVVGALIAVWDTSASTGKTLAKLTATNSVACPAILGTNPTVAPPTNAVPVAAAATATVATAPTSSP